MKRLILLVIWIFVLLPATATAAKANGEGDELLDLIKSEHLTQTSFAYRSAVGPRMLEEANYFSERLGLPTPHPIQATDLTDFHVTPPWFSKIENTNLVSPIARFRTAKFVVGGFIEITNFTFSFSGGRLFGIENRINHDERFSMYSKWAKTPSLIDINGAYQLATQWLASVDIDVAALNRKYVHKVEQRWFWNKPGLDVYHPAGDTNKTMLPIYEVTWGTNWANYPVEVQILGTTKELMKLHIGDHSLSRRKLMVITNAIELNNTPNPPTKRLRPISPPSPPDSKQTSLITPVTSAPLHQTIEAK